MKKYRQENIEKIIKNYPKKCKLYEAKKYRIN
jgi:hypothetical protein